MSAPITEQQSFELLKAVDYKGCSVNLSRLSLEFSTLVLTKKGAPLLSVDPRSFTWTKMFAWRWRHAEHITILETRATVALNKAIGNSCRCLRYFVLPDNTPSVGALAKGRSGSKRLNAVLRRNLFVVVRNELYPLYAWCSTHLQPADAYTRDALPGGLASSSYVEA